MELTIVESDLRTTTLIEQYESLVWTERYNSFGDFEVTTKDVNLLSLSLRTMKFVFSSESKHIMMIETIDQTEQSDNGEPLVKITGRSVEAFLEKRTCTAFDQDSLIYGNMSLSQVAAYVVDRYCVDPATAGANNVIPSLRTTYTPGNAEPIAVKRDTIYNVVKAVADSANMGFRIFLEEADGVRWLEFSTYVGTDRTALNEQYREYSEDQENFINSGYLASSKNWYTVARVHGARQSIDVSGLTPYSGWDRRVLAVNAKDIGKDRTDAFQNDWPEMSQRGREALAEANHRFALAIDGEIPPGKFSDPNVFYGLGDKVWVKDIYGNKEKMQITEEVWSVDAGSIQRTPTFSVIE